MNALVDKMWERHWSYEAIILMLDRIKARLQERERVRKKELALASVTEEQWAAIKDKADRMASASSKP